MHYVVYRKQDHAYKEIEQTARLNGLDNHKGHKNKKQKGNEEMYH